ncbi:MAG TPA: S1/P1 nuclease [Allosphingosinicella sp.]|nr:S1/P1 nuclease [Allosphingosinicella sp.]
MRWIIAAALASLYFLIPAPAHAWGQGGHYTVCEIGYLNLTPAAKAEVDRLVALDGRYASFTETCIFPDNKPVSRPSEHYANYPRTDRRIGPGCPGGRPCVLGAIESDLAILRSSSAPGARKATAILHIGHWFGDLHQPLHISFEDDRGGNSIKAPGLCSGSFEASLHSVWDSCVIERRIFSPGTDRVARARAAAALLNGSITDGQRRSWVRSQPWQWAGESYKITTAGRTGYCVRKSAACWYSAARREFAAGDQERAQAVDDDYLDRAKPIIEARLRRAGIRLAHALNRIFDPTYRGWAS